ncbi:hypothetical protein HCU01_04990 [Halomonas cupida]|uniref:UPF0434 protein HCU01_04990 n=1 Tax=Halomonas cupida TaxID=44933 RepID=A0A1M7A394_9GAMM|nr:Trm112 family protein [Halomonas cupida]GEN22550.1 hypothetical protein HCU01_04990 [Halomonas cupida]SHL37187.1 hypothetical protein SAMN05660971_00343 [Halomonas cupida]
MDKELLAMLVCPECQGKLKYDREAAELRCQFDGLAYPIRDDIPVMLAEEARRMDIDETLKRSPGSVSPGAPGEQAGNA